ncbi:MAG: ATP-dependent DNA ligase [Acidimicrobiales bacterium]|nr:ATP-dependent DNA ligase [Acidimicrobiales bacterium]
MKVSSPDKILFPDPGITKIEVVEHFQRVAPRMLDFATGRPLTLQRFPRGINAKGFMQKNAAEYFPPSIERLEVPKREGGTTVYPVVTDPADIAYLANQNTITFHMWTSSAEMPYQPDWMIIDLDPEDGDVAKARVATAAVRGILQRFDLDGFVLATGSKGFHVWVPLTPGHSFADVSRSSRSIAGMAALEHPEDLTLEFLKKNRNGRVFVDWLRNGPTATVVVPFSLRPRPDAPLAVPVGWNELEAADPDGWRIDSLDDRLDVEIEIGPFTLAPAAIETAARSAGVDLDTPHDRFGRNS